MSKRFKTISVEHGCVALTQYLQALSIIDDDETVTGITKAPGALDLKVEIKPSKDN